jgi:Family of unknown function (DUF5677)
MDMMGFGSQDEWERFNLNFPKFVEKYDALEETRDKIFQRKGEGNLFDLVIFGFGRVCSEDFQQALILCGNGFGIGALQIVRGMYERHVTAAYLLKHPDELDKFLEYDKVQKGKGLIHFSRPYTKDEMDNMVPREEQDRIMALYEEAKKHFTKPLCEKCKTTQPLGSWTKLSTLALAEKSERGLDNHYYHHYYEPTMFSHSTVGAIETRIRPDENGHPYFDPEGQHKKVKMALVAAHLLCIFVLDLQNDYFKLGFDDELKQLSRDYRDCWAPNEPDGGDGVAVG